MPSDSTNTFKSSWFYLIPMWDWRGPWIRSDDLFGVTNPFSYDLLGNQPTHIPDLWSLLRQHLDKDVDHLSSCHTVSTPVSRHSSHKRTSNNLLPADTDTCEQWRLKPHLYFPFSLFFLPKAPVFKYQTKIWKYENMMFWNSPTWKMIVRRCCLFPLFSYKLQIPLFTHKILGHSSLPTS